MSEVMRLHQSIDMCMFQSAITVFIWRNLGGVSKITILGAWESFNIYPICCNYHPLAELREGNVFIRVSQTVHRGPHVTITHDALKFTVHSPPHKHTHTSDMGLSWPHFTASNIWWPSRQSISEHSSACPWWVKFCFGASWFSVYLPGWTSWNFR